MMRAAISPPSASASWWPGLARSLSARDLIVTGSSPETVCRAGAGRAGGGLAFLAAPYVSEVQLRQQWQPTRSTRLSILAAREMVRLYMAGVTAVCPVLQLAEMCHAANLVPDAAIDPLDVVAWAHWSRPMLDNAHLVVVPDLHGWSTCPLIATQVQIAIGMRLPVHVYAKGAEA